jgi:hypothetical protein
MISNLKTASCRVLITRRVQIDCKRRCARVGNYMAAMNGQIKSCMHIKFPF